MEQLEFFPYPSPCIGVCEVNQKGYCKGCLRNREERMLWFKLSSLQKHGVVKLCTARKKKLQQLAIKQLSKDIVLPEQMDFDF